jgi:hypothetical protein
MKNKVTITIVCCFTNIPESSLKKVEVKIDTLNVGIKTVYVKKRHALY